ncbi:hypothetical protein Zmor_011983 [Zophobas morio]|uniref:TNase-like domain-containing protein n=1 Tax=Zophobas morio TaxID=2755281 RepID=A0AA38LZN6_9CUCU|nr:hypothetical protein Zmor_011983 [Zophobas morio]
MLGSCNVGEALIGKGLAKVIPHRMNDNDRSLHYEALVRAEAAAKAQLKGVHQPANKAPVHRLVYRLSSSAGEAAVVILVPAGLWKSPLMRKLCSICHSSDIIKCAFLRWLRESSTALD